jgi:hypothetical protein
MTVVKQRNDQEVKNWVSLNQIVKRSQICRHKMHSWTFESNQRRRFLDSWIWPNHIQQTSVLAADPQKSQENDGDGNGKDQRKCPQLYRLP